MDVVTKMEGLGPPVPSEQDVQQALCGQSEMAHIYRSVTPGTKESSSATEDEKTSSSLVDRTKSDVPVSPSSYRALCGVENCVRREISLVPDGDKLPPLLLAVGEKGKGKIQISCTVSPDAKFLNITIYVYNLHFNTTLTLICAHWIDCLLIEHELLKCQNVMKIALHHLNAL